jgi:hypothetical protein
VRILEDGATKELLFVCDRCSWGMKWSGASQLPLEPPQLPTAARLEAAGIASVEDCGWTRAPIPSDSIHRRMLALLPKLTDHLCNETIAHLAAMLRVGENRIAVEDLCTQLCEEEAHLPSTLLDEVTSLAQFFHLGAPYMECLGAERLLNEEKAND